MRLQLLGQVDLGGLARCARLECLELPAGHGPDIASVLRGLPLLRSLELGGGGLNEHELIALLERPLDRLELRGSYPLDSALRLLPRVPLVHLSLHGASRQRVELVSQIDGLRSLEVSGASWDSDLAPLAGHPHLRDLSFSLGGVEAHHLAIVPTLPTLRTVAWHGSNSPAAAAIARLEGADTLEGLWCANISSDAINALPDLPGLRSLSLRVSDRLQAGAFSRLGKYRGLEEVRLDLDGAGLAETAAGEPEPDLDRDGLGHLAALPRLHSLDLQHKIWLDSTSVTALVRSESLQELALPANRGLPGAGSPADLHGLGGLASLRRLTVRQLEPAARRELEAAVPHADVVAAP